MAKKVDVKLVMGEIRTVVGIRQSTLPDEIRKVLQGFYDNPNVENVDVRTEVRWDTAATGGTALLIVSYDETGREKKLK